MSIKAKVRYSLVNYTVTMPDGRKSNETAFRGEIIDIEDRAEAERLRTLGAIIAPDQPLETPGRLVDLPETASDEEVLNWVQAASAVEIRRLAADRPELKERLHGALQRINDARRRSDELLGIQRHYEDAIESIPERPEFDDLGRPTKVDEGTSAGVQQGVGGSASIPHDAKMVGDGETDEDPDAGAGDGGTPPPNTDDVDAVVRRNAKDVTEWVADHPERGAEVLEAENRLAAAGGNNGKPRETVIRAVQAAAGHTQ